MFEALCGSKNVQKILIFLFVNGKCYGSQIQRQLKIPLTPVQKALLRLEKGGLITSYYEGKTRLYQFNPAFPLLQELEALLKKAYTLLPTLEKKNYNAIKQEHQKKGISTSDGEQILLSFWNRLAHVKQLMFSAKTKSKEEGGWNGRGKGEVSVTQESDNVLIYSERGSWQGKSGKEFDFKNIFRWTLDKESGMISLEHLRRGINNPVLIFYLIPSGKNTLISLESHLCAADASFGQIFSSPKYVRLSWRVIGPKKNEELDYYYT